MVQTEIGLYLVEYGSDTVP